MRKTWQVLGNLACLAVLWIRLDDFGASEFGGGWLTGALLRWANTGGLFFLIAIPVTFFHRRAAAAMGMAGALLCLPFYLYLLVPGVYSPALRGETKTLFQPAFFTWNTWAAFGIGSLVATTILSSRSYSRPQVTDI